MCSKWSVAVGLARQDVSYHQAAGQCAVQRCLWQHRKATRQVSACGPHIETLLSLYWGKSTTCGSRTITTVNVVLDIAATIDLTTLWRRFRSVIESESRFTEKWLLGLALSHSCCNCSLFMQLTSCGGWKITIFFCLRLHTGSDSDGLCRHADEGGAEIIYFCMFWVVQRQLRSSSAAAVCI